MLESGSSGSVRGVLSNEHPYREPGPFPDLGARNRYIRSSINSGHVATVAACPLGAR